MRSYAHGVDVAVKNTGQAVRASLRITPTTSETVGASKSGHTQKIRA